MSHARVSPVGFPDGPTHQFDHIETGFAGKRQHLIEVQVGQNSADKTEFHWVILSTNPGESTGIKSSVNVHPMSNLNEIQRASSEQFGRQSRHYAKGHVLENVDDIRAALKHLKLPVRAKVLDVATGAGHTGLFFAGLGHDVTLGDIAQPMLDRALEAAQQRGLTVQTRLHAAEELPYSEGSFDLVTCRVAPHHFSSPAQFVREAARVLKAGGHFLLIDGTVEDNQPEVEAWVHRLEKLRDPSHNRLLTPGTWRRLCADNGLRVIHSEISPFKQPDLTWYFETAGTSPENRKEVLAMIAGASESVRRLMGLTNEDGKIIWWWQRLTLVAQKD